MKNVLVVGGTITKNLDKFILNKDISLLNSLSGNEYRFYSICKTLQMNNIGVDVAVSKESNSSLFDVDVIHTYKKKLWSDDLDRISKDYSLIIFSSNDFYGLPTLLYSKKKILVDLWNIGIDTTKTKKQKFFKEFLIEPMISEIKKKAIAVLYIADLQKILFFDKISFKVNFIPFKVPNFEKEKKILILNDNRNYFKKLSSHFLVTSFFEPIEVAISFSKNYLFFDWRLSLLINYNIPIIGDRRNITIKEEKRKNIVFGCDTTNFESVVKTISRVLNKRVKRKSLNFDSSNFVSFIKKSL